MHEINHFHIKLAFTPDQALEIFGYKKIFLFKMQHLLENMMKGDFLCVIPITITNWVVKFLCEFYDKTPFTSEPNTPINLREFP